MKIHASLWAAAPLVIFAILTATSRAAHASAESLVPCARNEKIHAARAKELQKILAADQSDDRKKMEEHPERPLDMAKLEHMADHDRKRRERVGKFFAEGCLKDASDYAAAAMVYQHGNVPDHYYQAFVWAQRAVEHGDESQKHLVALAIDRYLVSTGRKQLFASQFSKNADSACLCMEPVEPSFPAGQREKFQKNTLADQLTWLQTTNGKAECPDSFCRHELRETPAGSVPGFW